MTERPRRRWGLLALLVVLLAAGWWAVLPREAVGGTPPPAVQPAASPAERSPAAPAAPESAAAPAPEGRPLPTQLPPDAPMPPIDERDPLVLLRHYTHDELRLLAALERAGQRTPPAAAQGLLRLVRAGGDATAAHAYIRERLGEAGLAVQAAAHAWVRRRYGEPEPAPLLHQGGGEPLIRPLAPVAGPEGVPEDRSGP